MSIKKRVQTTYFTVREDGSLRRRTYTTLRGTYTHARLRQDHHGCTRWEETDTKELRDTGGLLGTLITRTEQHPEFKDFSQREFEERRAKKRARS